MRYSDLKDKDVKELQKMTEDLKIKLGRLRFELANKTLKDLSQIKKTKKDIAKVMTALRSLDTKMNKN